MNPILFIRTKVFKVNQTEFGRIADASQAAVSRWECGEASPTLDQVQHIRNEAKLRALGWDHDWLFGHVPAVDEAPNRQIRRRSRACV